MRITWLLVAGLGFAWVSCGDSTTGGDLFTPSAGTGATTGSGSNVTAGATTVAGAGGSATVGAGGPGGAGTTSGSGTTAGGSAGANGTAGAATTGDGAGGASGGSAGAASGSAGVAGSGSSAGGVSDGGVDAAPDGRAGASGAGGSPIDAAPDVVRGDVVRCGNTTCPVPSQFCCISTGNAGARCLLADANCPAGDDEAHCDDRTDCAIATQVCCVAAGAGNRITSMCRTAVACNGAGGDELCNATEAASCGIGSGTNTCRSDNQSLLVGYPYCH